MKSDESEVLVLTWDFPLGHSRQVNLKNIYLPNSSWAEGRNLLARKALDEYQPFEYYLFLDDDAVFTKGSHLEFEKLLLTNRPKVAVPLCDQIKDSNRYVINQGIQRPIAMDQVFQAFSYEVMHDQIAIPYTTLFDDESWWYACEINTYLIFAFYGINCLQFNTIEISNTNHNNNLSMNQNLSQYRGGITKKGMKKSRIFLKKFYPNAPFIINTIMHPRLAFRIKYYPSKKNLFSSMKKRQYLKVVKEILKMIIFVAGTFYNNIFFRNNVVNVKI